MAADQEGAPAGGERVGPAGRGGASRSRGPAPCPARGQGHARAGAPAGRSAGGGPGRAFFRSGSVASGAHAGVGPADGAGTGPSLRGHRPGSWPVGCQRRPAGASRGVGSHRVDGERRDVAAPAPGPADRDPGRDGPSVAGGRERRELRPATPPPGRTVPPWDHLGSSSVLAAGHPSRVTTHQRPSVQSMSAPVGGTSP